MNILQIKDLKQMDGEVGIEIEVEGENLPAHVVGWNKVGDGSLRGESCEYVIKKPCLRNKVKLYTNRIAKAYKDAGTIINQSDRTSVHIHINIQDMSLTEVYSFIALFLILETPLVKFCGDDRENNLFCLRSSDAEGLLTILEKSASVKYLDCLNTTEVRYSAINVSAIFKYGSLEFRSMRGTDDVKLIQKWVRILLKLKDAARNYESPLEIIEDFSMKGINLWVDTILGNEVGVVLDYKGWQDVLFDNMRSVQSLAYSGDWAGLSGEPPIRHAFDLEEFVNNPAPPPEFREFRPDGEDPVWLIEEVEEEREREQEQDEPREEEWNDEDDA
ncbi:MAG: amidoligase family protein [Deltaproteobacteria bacterium]|nr:amidoligase family protein [Deltaproteobacteria bacterium]